MSTLRTSRCKELNALGYRADDRHPSQLFALRFSRRGAIVTRPKHSSRRTEAVLLSALNHDTLSLARNVIRAEAEALAQVAERLDAGFERVVEVLAEAS